jgi:hypothetical protein
LLPPLRWRRVNQLKPADVESVIARYPRNLRGRPTSVGTMIPASAASVAPRNDVSSQGCTTMVFAARTIFAFAISRSYFDPAGHQQVLLPG